MAITAPPEHLWVADTLHLPTALVEDYRNQLDVLGRYNDACEESPRGEIGGVDEAATLSHFVHRFATSTARTEFLLLDPRREFDPIADELLHTFADGRISLLDIPCGSGASVLGFLSLLADLRAHAWLKPLPLNVSITAADISHHALRLYDAMLTRSVTWLEAQSIRVNWQTIEWNVRDEAATAQLYDAWIKQSPTSEEWIVLIAAFSGELGRDKAAFPENSRFFQHICARMYDRFGAVVWIEPSSNESAWLFRHLLRPVEWIARTFRTSAVPNVAGFHWWHPLKNCPFNGGLRVFQHQRTGGA